MEFKKVFRGYDPEEVDKHLSDTASKEQQIRSAQKERIDELLEENRELRKQVQQYQADEKAISNSLIASQNLAQQVKSDADRYSETVLSRAKIFCASWRAYSKMIVASLTDEEVREFNYLQRQIENLVSTYEGKQEKQVAATQACASTNPITLVEQACEQAVDLQELTNPSQSLEEICLELGIIKN